MKKVLRRIRQAHHKQAQYKVAIFDIDGTIFRSSLLIELTEKLIIAGIFPAKVRKIYINAYKNWRDRNDSYEKYIGAVIRAFEQNIRGKSHKEVSRIAKGVIENQQKRTYRYTRDLVRDLKRKKYYLLAISNSPREIVEPFCKRLGFDKIYGRVYEVGKNGKFTGKVLYVDLISDKAKILRRAVAKENLTLNNSVGIGDTESDIPFLKIVETPICFNPNRKLYNYAQRKGWKTVVERKDVIYEL